MRAALWAEWIKTRHALVPRVVLAALVLGPLALGSGLLAGAGNPAIAAQVSPFTTGDPWRDLATLAAVVEAAGGLLGFGILLSWSFGREFADRTVGGLFAAPVGLSSVAAAKLLVHGAVVAATALLLGIGLLPVGLALGLPAPRAEDLVHLGRTAAVAVLTGLGALPCAWVATLTRGLLAPIGVAVALLVSAEIAILTGIGAWYPLAAPGTWAGLAGTASDLAATPIQLALAPATSAVFAVLTLRAWARLHL